MFEFKSAAKLHKIERTTKKKDVFLYKLFFQLRQIGC